jgi:hypothetical protein
LGVLEDKIYQLLKVAHALPKAGEPYPKPEPRGEVPSEFAFFHESVNILVGGSNDRYGNGKFLLQADWIICPVIEELEEKGLGFLW